MLLAALAACDNTAQQQPPAAAEQLWLTPPAGWVLVASKTQQQTLQGSRQVRYQHPEQHNHFLTIESFGYPRTELPVDPLRQMDQLEADSRAQCPELQSFPTFAGLERDYPTVVRLLVCPPTATEDGRINLLKLMGGENTNYLVAFEKGWARVQDPEAVATASAAQDPVIAVWSLFLRNVYLCLENCAQTPAPSKR